MRILFITANRVGDAVLSTGLLAHLLARYPEARFTIVCGPPAEGVFARMPRRERTIVLQKHQGGLHWLSLWRQVAFQRWDWVIDLRGSALAWIVPARRRSVLRPGPGHKTAQLATAIGAVPPPLPTAWFAPEDAAVAASLLPAGRPVIALGPTANWTGKVWPPERFAALYRDLAATILPGAVPAIFAGYGPGETALTAPVAAALPEAIDLTGKLTLPEAAACLARAAIFIGNDSGLMHLAAAIGTPTLGLFGPTPVEVYSPSGRRAAAITSPDGQMAGLTVDAVLAAASALLGEHVALA
jgi:ADP-heptose:LPS heptosyltransferase